MNVSDEIRKTLSDPKPFYALAGVGDLAAERLKDAPERLREAPTLLAEAGATLTTIANKIAAEAPERLAKVTSSVQGAAGRGRPDPQALRDLAQTVAIQQVGRLLEAAGKAVETYDELAERGKVVVNRYAGSGETAESAARTEGPVTVLVEQVTDEDELTDVPTESAEEAAEAFTGETAAEAAEAFEAAAEAAAAEAVEPKPKAKPKPRTSPSTSTATPRKRAATPKSPRAPKA
ncbi:MAG TPA: hypothetical protein VH372_20745 [Actinospica sp.]|nr:hypothetical protein [Actinospica sp.]